MKSATFILVVISQIMLFSPEEILSERSRVLIVVSECIYDHLSLSKYNIYDHISEDYEKVKSIEEILNLLHISVN